MTVNQRKAVNPHLKRALLSDFTFWQRCFVILWTCCQPGLSWVTTQTATWSCSMWRERPWKEGNIHSYVIFFVLLTLLNPSCRWNITSCWQMFICLLLSRGLVLSFHEQYESLGGGTVPEETRGDQCYQSGRRRVFQLCDQRHVGQLPSWPMVS